MSRPRGHLRAVPTDAEFHRWFDPFYAQFTEWAVQATRADLARAAEKRRQTALREPMPEVCAVYWQMYQTLTDLAALSPDP